MVTRQRPVGGCARGGAEGSIQVGIIEGNDTTLKYFWNRSVKIIVEAFVFITNKTMQNVSGKLASKQK